MPQNGAKIKARQRRLIEALLAGQTVSQACRTAGVSRATCYRWMQQSHFVDALQQSEADLLTAVMRRLLGMQAQAVDGLQDLLNDKDLRPSDRLRTVQMVIDSLLRLRNAVELEGRLSELEKQVKQITSQSESPQTD